MSEAMPKILAVSAGAYQELRKRLEVTGLKDRIKTMPDADHLVVPDVEILDLGGDILLKSENDAEVKVWLIVQGQRL